MKKTPRILTGNIQFLTPPDDGFDEQAHEREEGLGGAGKTPITSNVDPAYEDRKKKFFQRHSLSEKAPVSEGGKKDSTPTQAQVDQAKKAAEDKEKLEAEQKEHSERVAAEGKEKRGPGSNVPHIIDSKRQAEKERDEFKAKYEEFETKLKPDYEKKIAELQAKIDSGDFTPTKEREFQTKITNLEADMKKKEDSLVTENRRLRDQISFYDIQNSEEFQREYIQPVVRAHNGMVNALNGSKKAMQMLQHALSANSLALNATTPEERQAALNQRGEAYSAILNEINDEVLREEFRGSFREYLRGADAHKKAMEDHHGTKAKVTKEAQLRAEKAYADQLATWGSAFDSKASAFKEDESLSQEELDIAKDLGLDPLAELKRNNHIASKVVVGQTTMDEALDIVHNGRVAPVLRARIKIMEQKIADQAEVIKKLRGSGTGGGGGGGGNGVRPPAQAAPGSPAGKEGEKLSREEWHKKFQPK